jgi:hypothetical protein
VTPPSRGDGVTPLSRGDGVNVRTRFLTTAIAMLAAGAVWFATVDRAAPRAAPRTAKTAASARGSLGSPPTAVAILATEGLALTSGQRAALESRAARWAHEGGRLEADVEVVTKAFEGFMRDAQDKGRTTLAEVRTRSEAFQSISAELRERRQRHSDDALSVLDERQRAVVTTTSARAGGTR